MADPVVLAVANVGVALTKVLLRACDSSVSADVVGDSQELVGVLSRALRRTGESKDQIERRVSQALVTRTKAMQERCRDQGVDPDLLSGACTEVEIILREIADDGTFLLSAVRHPDCFPETLRDYAARRRMNVESAAEPYFDELTNAVAAQYGALAPWSPRFQIEAFKSILSGIDEIQENSRRSLDAHAITHDKLDTLSSKLAEMAHHENTPSRVFFGSRPEVVTGDRYIERDEQKHLNELIVEPTIQRTVLVGMRGCGKSQLAAALAKQCEDANWSLVAWVNAVSPESIKSALVELAKQLQIDTSDLDNRDQIVRRCLDHLKSARPANRLIVFDNIEDINHLRGLMPNGDGLRVVATTTNNTGWEHQDWKIIKVRVFDRSDSINYLLTITTSNDQNAADALAERLGDLPLAVAQAAATARHKELSLPRYLKRLESHRKEHTICPVPGDDYTDDVATALCMAIEDALENLADPTRRYARRHLGALALLAESGVPTRWLDPTVEQQDNQELQGDHQTEDEDAHDALTELIHRSIVQQSIDKATTVLHRLQAQAFRESWDENETAEAYESAAILLDKVNVDRFPRNDTDSRRRETLDLIGQLRAISENNHSRDLLTYEQVIQTLLFAFVHAEDMALSSDALALEESVRYVWHLLGTEHPYVLTARNNLATAYLSVGRAAEAIASFEQVHADCQRVLGPDHPDTLASRDNLASAYRDAGRLELAYPLYEDVLNHRMRVLGKDHPDILTTRNNLASTYQQLGRSTEAIALFEQAIADSIDTQAQSYNDILVLRANLAGAYLKAGRPKDAISLLEQVHTESESLLGKDHPDTLMSKYCLAGAYRSADRFAEAIPLLEQTLTHRIHALGDTAPETLTERADLASVYLQAGRFIEAIDLYEDMLVNSKGILTEEHPDVLSSRNNLACAYMSAGRFTEAIALYEQILAVCPAVLGEEHPSTLASRNNLAYAYEAVGRFSDAIALYEAVLHKYLSFLGSDHPLTTTLRENLETAKQELEQQEKETPSE